MVRGGPCLLNAEKQADLSEHRRLKVLALIRVEAVWVPETADTFLDQHHRACFGLLVGEWVCLDSLAEIIGNDKRIDRTTRS